MAEGGGEEKDENPFSFKKFVAQSSGDSPGRSDESAEHEQPLDPDLPDVSASNWRREPERHNDRDTNHGNPFSFKKFLQSSSRGASNGSSSLATLDLAHDLPDFVQDHYTGTCSSESPRSRPRAPPTDIPLPDFALDSTNAGPSLPDLPQDHNHIDNSQQNYPLVNNIVVPPDINSDTGPNLVEGSHLGARPRSNLYHPPSPPAVPRLDVNDLQNSDSEDDGCQANATGGLPDFLPDSVVSHAGARPKVPLLENGLSGDDRDVDGLDEESLTAQIKRLREENERLHIELDESRRQAGQEARRVSSVLKEKDEFQRKEAEETAALEDIIVQVEANLKKATERAVTAENTVVGLKQDVRDLQRQLQRTQGASSGVFEGTSDDKSKHVAEQLVSSAKTAEVHLQQLLSGVEQLKLLADILHSGDKVRDLGSESRPPEGAEGGAPL